MESFITAVEAGNPFEASKLSALFAPTADIQEVSVGSGWGAEFCHVAERFDTAFAYYMKKEPMKIRPRQFVILLIAVVVVVVAAIISPKVLRVHRQLQLTQAAWAGDLATVRRCVEVGVDIDAWPPDMKGSGGGSPALTAAAYMGHEEIVRYLLDHGANPNLQPLDNPLILACWRQHPTVARLLLEHGADPNVMGEGTPLYAAESTGQTELAALLRQYGATLTFK